MKLQRDDQPWDAVSGPMSGLSNWWQTVKNCPLECPYDGDSRTGYKAGYSEGDPRVNEYWAAMREWEKENPMPFSIKQHGSCEEPDDFIAVTGVGVSGDWNSPEPVDMHNIEDGVRERGINLKAFCEEQGIKFEGNPAWWLLSYYG